MKTGNVINMVKIYFYKEFVMNFEEKYYQAPLVEIISIQDDVIRTSTGGDPYEDSWQDPNLNFGN